MGVKEEIDRMEMRDLLEGLQGIRQLSEEAGTKISDSVSFRLSRVMSRFKDEARLFDERKQTIFKEVYEDEDESDSEFVTTQRSNEFANRINELALEEVEVRFASLSRGDFGKKAKISPVTWELLTRGLIVTIPEDDDPEAEEDEDE